MASCSDWRDASLSQRYIIIPEDLFTRFTRSPTTIDLTLQKSRGGTPRTAGTYPPPRPLASSNWKKRQAQVKDYRVIGIDGVRDSSAMDGGGNDEDPDDIINLVARANTSKLDSSNILPRIRASPCQIHSKQSRRPQDLLYFSNHHGGKVPSHPEQTSRLHKDKSVRHSVHKSQLDTKPPEYKPTPPHNPVTYRRTVLPGDYHSQDFVMSWLFHGSAPSGQNHFPDIVKDGHKAKTSSQKQRLRNSLLSE